MRAILFINPSLSSMFCPKMADLLDDKGEQIRQNRRRVYQLGVFNKSLQSRETFEPKNLPRNLMWTFYHSLDFLPDFLETYQQIFFEKHPPKICGRKKKINQPTLKDIGKINPESVPEVPTSPHPTSPGGGVTKPSQLEIAVQHEDMVSCWEPLNFDDAIDPPTKNDRKWRGSINPTVLSRGKVSCKQKSWNFMRTSFCYSFSLIPWHLNMRYVRIHACTHVI